MLQPRAVNRAREPATTVINQEYVVLVQIRAEEVREQPAQTTRRDARTRLGLDGALRGTRPKMRIQFK